MNGTLIAFLKGVARSFLFLLFGFVILLVAFVLSPPLLWGIIIAVVGGIATALVRDRVFPRLNLATVVGELATIALVTTAVLVGFNSDINEFLLNNRNFNRNVEIIGGIFITITIVNEVPFRKRDHAPDAP